MQIIKVLHIIKSLGRGGAETLLPETLSLHDKVRFEFHYIYFLPWKDQMVDAIEEQDGKVTCLAASNNFKLLQQYKKVISYCKLNNINLIHCHLPWSGFLGRIVYAKTKIPLIYTEHNIQERYHILTKLLNKSTFNNQSIALGVSKDVSRSIKQHINPKIPIQTLLNGVNTDKFTRDPIKGQSIRDQYSIPEEAVVIGNIAVFREQKCIPDWLHAFKSINHKNNNVYGLLVGAGPLETEIKTLVKELKLENNVILAGLQTDTVSYFSAMDIFMMSSAFEGLPIALLEAMSMQCAVISTKAGGVVEVVRDSQDGLLCEVGDIQNMASIAADLSKDKDKRIAFQNAARARVVDAFSLTNMVAELEKVYTKYNKV
tara:strand:+ start:714 stop:1829 length:1116 start_codon:yes stop_codon:yes gene_type:complete